VKTPANLARKVSSREIQVAPYDWKRGRRGDETTMGRYTANSIQTFDPFGKPRDAQSDNND